MTVASSAASCMCLKSGARWADAPAVHGPRKTLYNRFVRWAAASRATVISSRARRRLQRPGDARPRYRLLSHAMDKYHLAQINIGRYIGDGPGDARFADFMAALDPINALAEASAGFVWRLQDDSGNATAILAFDDPRILLNMSIWESVEALADFSYRTAHAGFVGRRREWFEQSSGTYLALWWVPAGHVPGLDEAKARLDHIAEHGPTPHAFTIKHPFPPPDR